MISIDSNAKNMLYTHILEKNYMLVGDYKDDKFPMKNMHVHAYNFNYKENGYY